MTIWNHVSKVLGFSKELCSASARMKKKGHLICVFASSRFAAHDPHFETARHLGKLLAQNGFPVITGGGPGSMEAVSRGVREAGGFSVGCHIQLPQEMIMNPFVDQSLCFTDFHARKLMLLKYSRAFIALPGGMGTLNELTEVLTLLQTDLLKQTPLILIGQDYWKGLLHWLKDSLVRSGALYQEEFENIILVDTPEEAVRVLLSFQHRNLMPVAAEASHGHFLKLLKEDRDGRGD